MNILLTVDQTDFVQTQIASGHFANNKTDVVNLFRFIDWLLKLPKALDREFWQELKTYEEEAGRTMGREEGQRSLITVLLNQKFGDISPATTDRLDQLSAKQLESLAIALLNFTTIDDLTTWLDQQN
jgi:predicted transposase YdaD